MLVFNYYYYFFTLILMISLRPTVTPAFENSRPDLGWLGKGPFAELAAQRFEVPF